NRLLPHDGVVLSTTSGHSPACALRYIVTRSRLLFPHGEGAESRYVHTSSTLKCSIGVETHAVRSVVWRDSLSPAFRWSAITCARVALSARRTPRTRMTSPYWLTRSAMKRFAGSIFRRSVHQRNLR